MQRSTVHFDALSMSSVDGSWERRATDAAWPGVPVGGAVGPAAGATALMVAAVHAAWFVRSDGARADWMALGLSWLGAAWFLADALRGGCPGVAVARTALLLGLAQLVRPPANEPPPCR